MIFVIVLKRNLCKIAMLWMVYCRRNANFNFATALYMSFDFFQLSATSADLSSFDGLCTSFDFSVISNIFRPLVIWLTLHVIWFFTCQQSPQVDDVCNHARPCFSRLMLLWMRNQWTLHNNGCESIERFTTLYTLGNITINASSSFSLHIWLKQMLSTVATIIRAKSFSVPANCTIYTLYTIFT